MSIISNEGNDGKPRQFPPVNTVGFFQGQHVMTTTPVENGFMRATQVFLEENEERRHFVIPVADFHWSPVMQENAVQDSAATIDEPFPAAAVPLIDPVADVAQDPLAAAAPVAPEPSPAVVDAPPTPDTTATGDAEPTAEVVAPLYKVGERVEHYPYGLATVIGSSHGLFRVRFDVAPDYLGGEFEEDVTAEELQSASPYTKDEAFAKIRKHFSLIFGDDDWGCVTFINSDDDNAPVINKTNSVTRFTTDKGLAHFFKQNETQNVYVAMNSIIPQTKDRRRKEDLCDCRNAFMEVDENGEEVLAAVRASVAKNEIPRPSVILKSSPGKHQFIWAITGFKSADVEALNSSLVRKFGGDPASSDVLRLLRIPCLRNLKYKQRPVVEVIEANDGPRYTQSDFTIAIEQVKNAVPARPPADKTELIATAGYVEANMTDAKIHYEPLRKWGENGWLWELTCPFVKEHTGQKDSGTVVILHKSGAISFECAHGHCKQRVWNDFKEYIKSVLGYYSKWGDGSGYGQVLLGGKTSGESSAEVEAKKAADAAKTKEIEAKQPTSDPIETLKRLEKQKATEELEKHRVTPETQEKAKEDRSREIEARIDKRASHPRPVFPYWVMEGTSLYEGLVKPAVEQSSKHAEFIFMAGVQIVLNYLDRKVFISCSTVNFNMYLGFISPPGKFFKSSSSGLAHKYYKMAGLTESFRPSGKNENSKETIFIFQTGSTEGMGKSMYKLGATNAILFNDELGKLVSKAGIENSTLPYDLLSFYESDEWGNTVSTEANCFAFPAKTYTIGWNFCTTDRGFNKQWPRIAGLVSGMEDRMFFIISPNKMKPTKVYRDPEMATAPLKSKDLLTAAIRRHIYSYDSLPVLHEALEGLSARSINLVQALALYFAVDLGHASIDDDCIKRAAAVVQYRNDGIAFLQPIEASTPQGRRQKEIERELRQHGGMMKKRVLCQNLDYTSDGSEFWNRAYDGLIKDKRIVEWDKKMISGQWARMVGLLRHVEDVDGVVDADEDQAA